ncbi:MAG: hypothetical protein KAU60_06510, partial [Desulfobacterales bacterium]|nr:hypothetical protein [Desulfobacterales bacterium]
MKNVQFCSSSRKAKILTGGIHRVFRGLKFEPDAVIGQKGAFCKGLEVKWMLPVIAILFVIPYVNHFEKKIESWIPWN